jgi:hypothetical protein
MELQSAETVFESDKPSCLGESIIANGLIERPVLDFRVPVG